LALLSGWFRGLWLLVPLIVIKVLAVLGVSVVSYVGITALLDSLQAFAISQLAALPAALISLLNLGGFRQALSMIISAYFVRAALDGVSAWGSIARFRLTAPPGP